MPDVEFPVGYRRCPGCGAANFGRLTKCLRCGSELPFDPIGNGEPGAPKTKTDQVQARFCARCGKPVPTEYVTKFCRHCGYQLQ